MSARGAIPIVALDVADGGATRSRSCDRLGDACRFYKVGSELFTAAGPAIVRQAARGGARRLPRPQVPRHPEHRREAARERGGARGAPAHGARERAAPRCSRAAVEGAGAGCGVLAVTVLTSLDAAALGAAWGRDDAARRTARCCGWPAWPRRRGRTVSSAAGGRRRRFARATADALAPLVPGIRLAGGAAHDQARTVTPASAAAAGARYLVLGRAVTAAPDPAPPMRQVHEELAVAGKPKGGAGGRRRGSPRGSPAGRYRCSPVLSRGTRRTCVLRRVIRTRVSVKSDRFWTFCIWSARESSQQRQADL